MKCTCPIKGLSGNTRALDIQKFKYTKQKKQHEYKVLY